ncbi:MAG TPA: pyridoxamine 5'-phosphate oxidase family protein [Thermoplasmata archaeon]|nr:pyridoxamine 5'-phosphate oxidase family protein [Thermoplasmata archaeon]
MVQIPEQVRRFVEEQRLGFVATVNLDGSPNVSPKGTVTIWDEEHLVFADLASPTTVRNLEHDPRSEVCVVDPVSRKGWRFRGQAEVLHLGDRFREGVRFFEERQLPDAPARIRSIVLVGVDALAPLISPAYSTGLTEEEVRRRSWSRFQKVYGQEGLGPK